jgi:hypothetical protein
MPTLFKEQLDKALESIKDKDPLVSYERIIVRYVDFQYNVSCSFAGLIAGGLFHKRGAVSQIIFNAFLSNLYHFHAATELNKRRLHGSVPPILRLAYEGLLIAKFCSLSPAIELFERWQQGDPRISLNRDVFQRIRSPDVTGLRQLWRELCSVTHFSTYSGQPYIQPELVEKQVRENYAVLVMLLLMNEHLLRMHLMDRSILYYLNRYAPDESWHRALKRLREATKTVKPIISKAGRKVVNDFGRKWLVS